MDTNELISRIEEIQEYANKSVSSALISEIVDKILSYRPLVVTFGNGGSFSVAQHLAIDLLPAGVPAITLGSNPAILTAISNDFSYEQAPMMELFNFHETNLPMLLITFSVSGRSKNIVKLHTYFGSSEKCVGNYLVCGGSAKLKNTKVIEVAVPAAADEFSPYARYWICENTFSYIAHLIAGLVRIRVTSLEDEQARTQNNTTE